MNRRTAMLLGSLVAILAAAELVVLSGLLAAERRDDRERYAEAITRQRRAAGRTMRMAQPIEHAATRATFCVHGVDTFVATLRAALDAQLVDGKQRLDVTELAQLSNLAIRAERYVEQANAGPAMPQRMGRTSHTNDQGQTEWKPFEPARSECEDGDAYAMFRLDIRDIDAAIRARGTATDPAKTPATKKTAPARSR